MGVYKRSGSRICWLNYIGPDGHQVRESSGTTNRRVAERILATRKAQVVEGRWNLPRSNSPLLSDWASEVISGIANEKTRERYENSTQNLVKYFGAIRISDITPQRIYAFQQARLAANRHPATVNRDRAFLSKILNRARKLRLITTNPCLEVDPLDERSQRRHAKPLSYDEEAAILARSPMWLRMLIILLVETGLRVKKEALPLRWCPTLTSNLIRHQLQSAIPKLRPGSGAYG